MKRFGMLFSSLIGLLGVYRSTFAHAPTTIPEADVPIPWVQPLAEPFAPAVWGIKNGLSIGLWPTNGPRGLLRIYTPYLNQQPRRIMQFIAIEPIVAGHRDLSEMQKSRSDGKPGKPMWTTDQLDLAHPPGPSTQPARGVIVRDHGIESLSFYIIVEPFDNGAQPIIKATIRSDHPHELMLQTFASANSAVMESCVLTATMGNWSRLRHLHLKNQLIESTDLFKNATLDSWQFFPWHSWSADQLPFGDGDVTFVATGDIESSTPSEVPKFWHYQGEPARQYWRTAPCPGLVGRVNGRTTFWGTNVAIPGGAAFENFELMSPYSPGQVFYFGVDPLTERQ